MTNDLFHLVDEEQVSKDLNNISQILKKNVALNDFTTFRLGGTAKYFIEADTVNELTAAIRYATAQGLNYKILGVGANVLIPDEGVDILVIRNRTTKVIQDDLFKGSIIRKESENYHQSLSQTAKAVQKYTSPATSLDNALIALSGTPLAQLIRKSFSINLTGLEYFTGIPATVGGAIYNNIHGGSDLFCEFVESVLLSSPSGMVKQVKTAKLSPRYDWSRLHETQEIVLGCRVLLSDQESITETIARSQSWKKLKLKTQPQTMTAGCVFKNVTPEIQKSLGISTMSAGYIIEKMLKAKGWSVGGAYVSDQHANFIVNDGTAQSSDVKALIENIQKSAKNKLGIDLELEVELW